jgi:tetratricopeptide (TPR) repeat protein
VEIRIALRALAMGCLVLGLVSAEGAVEVAERGPDDPAFVTWMKPENPDDQTILQYWERAKAGQLGAEEIVDLGTMLYHRGFPDDAVTSYRNALEIDSELHEAWFRIGFIKHRQGDVDGARKRRPGHGWCNFYLGLLEEQTRHPSRALEHYQLAFKHAPELADPAYNPEVLSSELSLGATLYHNEKERFATVSPMSYLRPGRVKRVRSLYAPSRAGRGDDVRVRGEGDGASAPYEGAAASKGAADATCRHRVRYSDTAESGSPGRADSDTEPVRGETPAGPCRSTAAAGDR